MAFTDLFRNGVNNLNRVSNVANQFNQNLNSSAFSQIQTSVQQVQNLSNSVSQIQSRFSDFSASASNIQNNFRSVSEKLSSANIANDIDSLRNAIPSLTDFNSANQAISVLPQALGDLTGPVTQVRSAVEDFTNLAPSLANMFQQQIGSISSGFQNGALGFGPGGAGPDSLPSNAGQTATRSQLSQNVSLLPNPLRNYASCNYVITLGCLSKSDINTPVSTYRSNGLSKIVLRSSGGTDNRVTTAAEDIYGRDAEYYIEDLEYEAIVAPNSNTGVTNGTNISFTILEPYSMGQFVEALGVAALEQGHDNYIEAPYVLEIRFVGYDDNGVPQPDFAAPPKYIPFKFTDVQFQVDGEGSKYSCEALPYNEIALIDEVNSVPVDSVATGETVAELLQNKPEESLTEILNARLKTLEDTNILNATDKYLIIFPPSKDGVTQAVDTAQRNIQDFALLDPGIQRRVQAAGTSASKSVYETLKAYAKSSVNEIGNSQILDEPTEAGNHPTAKADETIYPDGPLRIIQRDAASLQTSETEREYNFTQGDRITDIIEQVIMNSRYGRELAEQEPQNGKYRWFRIETFVFIEPDRLGERQLGRDPKVYAYVVTPYLVDEDKFLGPERKPENTEALAAQAIKTYNYLYSGLNEDVLDFQIDFKFAFYQNVLADIGQLNDGRRRGATGETVNNGQPENPNIAPTGVDGGSAEDPNEAKRPSMENTNGSNNAAGGVPMSEVAASKIAIAQSFHDSLINSNSDMLQAELEIWGDPYFLPTSGMGNYNASPAGPMITSDATMDYQTTEVFIKVNFRTPLDYDQETGLMTFSRIVRQFSGIYQVISVLNKFSSGQFTQTLQLNRRVGQTDVPTGDSESLDLGRNNPDLSEGGNNQSQGGGAPVGTPGAGGGTSGSPQGVVTPGTPGGSNNTGTAINAPDVQPTGPQTGQETGSVTYVNGFAAKRRNKPVQDRLLSILDTAAQEAGVRVIITSGGQDSPSVPNARRVGSHRHDNGYAADIQLISEGRVLNVANSQDLGIVQTFVNAAKAAGATAVGAGNGYMSNTSLHVDIARGQPGVGAATYWGTPDARSAGAPSWLRQIMVG